jgi:hypothetical protein
MKNHDGNVLMMKVKWGPFRYTGAWRKLYAARAFRGSQTALSVLYWDGERWRSAWTLRSFDICPDRENFQKTGPRHGRR